MGEKNILQFDSAILQAGNVNVAEAIESDGDILFNETYVVVGDSLSGKSIHATYDLTVIGNLFAETIEVNGDLTVNGDIKASTIRCGKLVCTGKVSAETLVCGDDSYSKSIATNIVQTQGSLIVLDSLVIDEKCEVERNIVTGEGVSGVGKLVAESVISGDYFDFDGDIAANVFEIETLFKHEKDASETSIEKTLERDERECTEKFDDILSSFFDELVINEEEELLDLLAEMAEIQRVSFSEMYYLFSEIVRISQRDEVTNLKDYLLVQYAYTMFPIKLLEYNSIAHVFTKMVNTIDPECLEYSAENLVEFSYSLKILTTLYDENESFAEKVFESIGLKYSFVNKQFERR